MVPERFVFEDQLFENSQAHRFMTTLRSDNVSDLVRMSWGNIPDLKTGFNQQISFEYMKEKMGITLVSNLVKEFSF